jgi:acyl-CoA reductase-like NAD-dependent aldehyde dehydrogenase
MNSYQNLNKQYINGQWKDGRDDVGIDNLNPFTDKVIHHLTGASNDDVDDAFDAAKAASVSWESSNPFFKRDILLKAAALLLERKEEFIQWLRAEVGSPYLKAVIEVQQVHDALVEASSFPTRMHGRILASSTDGKESYIYRKPIGVVSVISPWNFPLYLSMRTVAPALGTGNTVVLKPASQSLVTGGTLIAKLFEEAGLPAGVLNVVVGRSGIIGDHFTAHVGSKYISFTGSTAVGTRIGRIAGEKIKKTALELGGNNALIILEDADLDRAVDSAVFGRYLFQGQLCISLNRILVHESISETFRKRFVKRVKDLPYGDPDNNNTVVGPLIDKNALHRILDVIKHSVADGAKVETGYKAEGNVLLPTVLSGVTDKMRIFKEEIFGPAIGIITFNNEDDAVRLANGTGYGLSGAIHTKDVYRGMTLARRIETGMMHINDQPANDEVHTPFGGEGFSGIGRFGGDFIMDELTTVQWVSVQKGERIYPF